MGMTKQEQEATIDAVAELRQRIQALEDQVRDLQTLVMNLKMYPPVQVFYPSYPPPVVPYNPLPGYPFPYSVTYAPNSSPGKIP